MPGFALFLRCLIVLAFCLDGTAMAWQSSAMAIATVQHTHSHAAGTQHADADADHGMQDDGMLAMDCEQVAIADHSRDEECACSDGGCDCACGFVTLALGRGVPAVNALWIGFMPVSHHVTTIRPTVSASVFRPPIG